MMIKGQVSVWIVGSPNTPMQMQNAQKSQSVASSCKLELDMTLQRIQYIAKCYKGTELQWGGDTAQKKTSTGRGGHRTYFVDGGNNWGGDTAQH